MNPLKKILSGQRNRSDQQYERAEELRLQVSNITRDTVLATRMELADSGSKRNKGLLGREGLAPGEGLWIVPCEAVHTFAMRFPIDLVYIDRNNRIKKVRSAVPAWRLSACLSAHSVLELPSGTICNTQTQPGDTLEFLASSQSTGGNHTLA
jgi:hypothetical protein